MFAYCINNPINRVDSAGTISWLIIAIIGICMIGGGIIGFTSNRDIVDEMVGQNSRPPATDPSLTPPPKPEQSDSRLMPPYRVDPLPTTPEYNPPSNFSTNNTHNNNTASNNQLAPFAPNLENNLTTGDRISNTIIGMGMGAMVGGGVVLLIGAGACIGGAAATVVPLLGMTGKQAVAWGILAYDVFPIFISPFLGEEMEPLEYPS